MKHKSLLTTKPKAYGARPDIPDPRQTAFLTYYLDPSSETFSNAYRSALKAGYSEMYAGKITDLAPNWLAERVESSTMLAKSVRNLARYLDMETKVPAMGAFGPIFEKVKVKEMVKLKNGKTKERSVTKKVPVLVTNTKILAIQQDTSKFVAERIGRSIYGRDADAPPVTNNIFIIDGPQRARIARRVIARLGGGEGALSGLRDRNES